jgi:sigma-B regulation protein RsbU (phosphoserine phosphatase)
MSLDLQRREKHLNEKNALLEDSNQELQAQNEEIQSQTAELKELNEELEHALNDSESRAHELSILFDVGHTITASLEFDELVSVLENQIKDLLDADASSIMLFDERKHELIITGGRHLRRRDPISEHTDRCEGIAATVARTGIPQLTSDIPNCGHCKYGAMACEDGGTHHMISVPMFHKGEPVGAINAFRQNKPVFTKLDEQLLTALANAASIAFQNSRVYEREHKIAEKLQMSLLPKPHFKIPGFMVGCHYNPASSQAKVGGDFYDVMDIGEGKVAVVMGDVSGKGIDAAIYTAMVKYMLRAFILTDPDPAKALTRLNDALSDDLAPPEIFVTLFLGILDTERKTMVYANAGHDQPLFYSRNKKSCIPCDVTGRAIGMLPDADYSSRSMSFDAGDMVLMYTDGITEARNELRHFLGQEGLEQILYLHTDKSAQDIVAGVFNDVKEYARKLNDDAALLVVKAVENN